MDKRKRLILSISIGFCTWHCVFMGKDTLIYSKHTVHCSGAELKWLKMVLLVTYNSSDFLKRLQKFVPFSTYQKVMWGFTYLSHESVIKSLWIPKVVNNHILHNISSTKSKKMTNFKFKWQLSHESVFSADFIFLEKKPNFKE